MTLSGFSVIVRCADPRLEPFFTSPDSRQAMGLPAERAHLAEAHISNVGGLLSLTGAEVPRLVHDAGLLVRLFGGQRSKVVLTAHSSCGGYEDALEGDAPHVRERQVDDMRTTAHRLRESLDDVEVSAFYLDLEAGRVERVDL